jgi:hypothetical protein
MDAAKIEKQINSYLPGLSLQQKKAVLTVVKTFASESQSERYDEEFKKELDSRYEEYLNGGTLLTQDEVNARLERILNDNKKK